jgi:hypothetical protein
VDPNSELENYLAHYHAEGLDQGEGDFTLDPLRALEILSEQGSVASHAPLFLFRAIYRHTGGATVLWKRAFLGGSELVWPSRFGPLPKEAMRILAEGAFEASHVQLRFEPDRVAITSPDLRFPTATTFRETFQGAESRLRHYPVDGLFQPPQRSSPWHRREYPEGSIELRRTELEPQAIHFVVDGIEFTESSTLPLNVTVFDDGLKCDLSLTRIPDSDRKKEWGHRAEEILLKEVGKVFGRVEAIKLDFDHLSNEMLVALGLLPYLVGLPAEDTLRKQVLRSVMLRDLFGQYWSLESLFESEKDHGSLFVLDSIPRNCPDKPTGQRPVLHWRGDTKLFGEALFDKTKSGAGYIYSLSLGGSSTDGLSALEAVDWEGGHLSLLPLGREESRCEIQLVGKRRGSESIYLDEPAPPGLRLIWRSQDELASWDPSADFMAQVVAVVDKALARLGVNTDWVRNLLTWTGVNSLEGRSQLNVYRFFETVAGELVSPEFLKKTFADQVVPVLEERSASLPSELPFAILLWDHPLLEQLGFPTQEESNTVRKAFWREDGRNRWLAKHKPMVPQEWADTLGIKLKHKAGQFIAVAKSGRLTQLMIWREGRPLGQIFLSEDQFPRGYVLVYVDDEFPADEYWSGPDRDAMSRLDPWIEEMRP